MKRRIRKCRVLVGWEDTRMTIARMCGSPADFLHVGGEIPPNHLSLGVCKEHRVVNEKKDLTLVDYGDMPMMGAGKGSRYEKL